MRRGGYQHGLDVVSDECSIVWTLADGVERGAWSSAQTAMIERLLPHIRQFAEARSAVAGTRDQHREYQHRQAKRAKIAPRQGPFNATQGGAKIQASKKSPDQFQTGKRRETSSLVAHRLFAIDSSFKPAFLSLTRCCPS